MATEADLASLRSRKVLVMLCFLWVINIMDLVLTMVAIRMGGFVELNPIARLCIHDAGLLGLFKMSLLLFSTLILFGMRRRKITEWACHGLCGVYTGLAFIWGLYFLPFA